MLAPWKKSFEQPRLHIKKQRHYFVNKSPSSQSYSFPVVMNGKEELGAEELMLLNCGVGEDSRESLGLQGDPANPS